MQELVCPRSYSASERESVVREVKKEIDMPQEDIEEIYNLICLFLPLQDKNACQ